MPRRGPSRDRSSPRIPPEGANRGRYRNPQIDKLKDEIRVEMEGEKRKELCSDEAASR
jgi:hypothetical protein